MSYFPSKKSLWVGVIYWGVILGTLLSEVWNLFRFSGWNLVVGILFGLLFLIPFYILGVWIWFGTGYTFTDKSLAAKCGPFQKVIALNNIRSVKHTRALWTGFVPSYTLSRDRLEVKYKYGTLMLSPADTFTFISELKQRSPDVEILE
ncbi:MAG TPA: hypothetical protein DDW83_01835 [Peptococcaceae bacterium]|nr:hypothetical protein [Peptococcaceae bacterium]